MLPIGVTSEDLDFTQSSSYGNNSDLNALIPNYQSLDNFLVFSWQLEES